MGLDSFFHLCIKGIVMKKVSTVKLLAVGLVQCNHIFFATEDLNLRHYMVNHLRFENNYFDFYTSSAISGPLLTKGPCLVMVTSVLVEVKSTASLLSVLRNMM